MKRILLLAIAAGLLAGCNKDKFQTVPQVKITDFGPAEVSKGQLIHFSADVTDKEGDVQDSVIFYRKVYATSGSIVSTDSSIRTTLKDYGIPSISNQKYELTLTMVYGEIRPEVGPIQNGNNTVDRQLSVGVYVKDKAGHRSEYVESDKILLKKIQ